MRLEKLTGSLGAELFDVDAREDSVFPRIKAAFAEHSVLVLRNQTLSPEEHLNFARRWGVINVNRFFRALPDHPEIAEVLKEANHTSAIGETWHTDHSYDRIPAMGSILHAIETPKFGGDTIFCSMRAAYDGLTDVFKDMIGGLSAWHSSRHVFGENKETSSQEKTDRIGNETSATQDALHPVVIQHPLSGRPCLYVNPQFTTRIEGLAKAESDSLLAFLFTHCQKPDYQCRVRWTPGDLTLWDNRATWHKAINDYPGQRRYMHRITIEGCALNRAPHKQKIDRRSA